ncbi:MAG: hypothetical protein K2M46_06775 [Lachnospiraceae bacterium]|nr:hypothetical protein [Lachnospiraceae bacterium]
MVTKKEKSVILRFLSILAVIISTIIPMNTIYAAEVQNTKQEHIQAQSNADEMLCGCVLDDGLTVFDAWEQSGGGISCYTQSGEESKTVNEVVVFIRFADEPENIYDERGGYNYIKSLYGGYDNSLKAYVDEFSWGQIKANTYFWPQSTDGTSICYVDKQPVSYYKKKSADNPNGYTEIQKADRRETLLNNAVNFMGNDFLEKLGIAGEPYNLVFMVPDCEEWNDLLWSHKYYVNVNGVKQPYNLITFAQKTDISRTITHEFMHSLGYPDMYRSSNSTDDLQRPLEIWSIMANTSLNAGHPTVHEKSRYGGWIDDNAIETINHSGHYRLGPSTAESSQNTVAYKIPVEGKTDQYFMIEYRGSRTSGFDSSLDREGLIFYRVNTAKKGNFDGPPDEVYLLREQNRKVYDSYYNGSTNRTEFSNFKLYNDDTDLGIRVYNIKKELDCMSFDIELPKVPATISQINTDAASPQRVGATIKLSAVVENDEPGKSTYAYIIEKNGTTQKLPMTDNYSADWSPKESGIYTIRYTVTDEKGVTVSKELKYIIGTESTAYVLYNNSSWNEAYIHYKVGNGAWTSVPGVQMLDSGTEGYTWVYAIEVGKEMATVCFNNGKNSWDNNGGQDYTVTAGVNGFGGKDVTLTSVEINTTGIQKKYSSFEIAAQGGITPYSYECSVRKEGSASVVEHRLMDKYAGSKYNYYSSVYETGKYVFSVTVTDAYGQTITKEQSFELAPFTISNIKTSVPSPQKAGTEIVLTEERQNPYIYKYGISGNWTIRNKTTGTAESKRSYYSDTIEWVPKENGEYEITVNTTDHAGETATYTISYTIGDEIAHKATVYYANNSWDKAYIHYKVGNGDWTTVPGTLMEVTSEQNGYTWKYTIELGEENGAVVCFNNGNGSWDSKNGSNYNVGMGTYGIKESVLTDLNAAILTPTAIPTPIAGKSTTIYYANDSWSQAYIHYKTDSGEWTEVPGVLMETDSDKEGYTWKYVIDLADANTATFCFNNGNNLWDSQNGSNYSAEAGVYGIKNGVLKNLQEIVTEKTVTIYYNTGWNTPYVHYCIGNGSWTNVPGMVMAATAEKCGYTHKAVIPLGDADSISLCFNNGSDSWDSRDGSNYNVNAGVWGISNGSITNLE